MIPSVSVPYSVLSMCVVTGCTTTAITSPRDTNASLSPAASWFCADPPIAKHQWWQRGLTKTRCKPEDDCSLVHKGLATGILEHLVWWGVSTSCTIIWGQFPSTECISKHFKVRVGERGKGWTVFISGKMTDKQEKVYTVPENIGGEKKITFLHN